MSNLEVTCPHCGKSHRLDFEPVTQRRLERIERLLVTLGESLMSTSQNVIALQAAVAAQNTVEASVVTLLQTLSANLSAAQASGDPAAIQAVIADIDSHTAQLSAAVTANTPAAAPAPSAPPAAPSAPPAGTSGTVSGTGGTVSGSVTNTGTVSGT